MSSSSRRGLFSAAARAAARAAAERTGVPEPDEPVIDDDLDLDMRSKAPRGMTFAMASVSLLTPTTPTAVIEMPVLTAKVSKTHSEDRLSKDDSDGTYAA